MPIVEYKAGQHRSRVTELFAAIYPQWTTAECQRMAYDEKHPRHKLTLLAMQGEMLIGQINIWGLGPDQRLGNVGYHVHPNYQRRGVGALLLTRVAPSIDGLFQDGIVVQTTPDNAGSIALARKAGFTVAPKALLQPHGGWLKATRLEDGVCLHLPPERLLRVTSLEKGTHYASRLLKEDGWGRP